MGDTCDQLPSAFFLRLHSVNGLLQTHSHLIKILTHRPKLIFLPVCDPMIQITVADFMDAAGQNIQWFFNPLKHKLCQKAVREQDGKKYGKSDHNGR